MEYLPHYNGKRLSGGTFPEHMKSDDEYRATMKKDACPRFQKGSKPMELDYVRKDALFADGTEEYCNPPECDPGDEVTLRFRTLRDNADQVILVHAQQDGEQYAQTQMQKTESGRVFDFYEAKLRVGAHPIQYYFEVIKGEERCDYTRLGAGREDGSRFHFELIPGFHVPGWAKGCIMYQIFTDRFANGSRENDVRTGEYRYLEQESVQVNDWDAPTAGLDVGRFYGGDLIGVEEKLSYLQSLGVEAIYFNPLFVSPSNHKYDCQDYEHIDPHLTRILHDGDYSMRTADPENLKESDRWFAAFVEKCHASGIRVIIDGVFNHCGSFHKMMDRAGIYAARGGYPAGAYAAYDSQYHDHFLFADDRPEAWPDNGTYEKWWGNETLPKLNYEGSTSLETYILDIGRKWVSPPYNADGWRLDVAADLGHSSAYNHAFWKKFRAAVKEANPDALILAEHYGDPAPWLSGTEWDTVMNYDAFMEPVGWFLTGMEKHSDARTDERCGDAAEFFETMLHGQCAMHPSSVLSAMNELSNHDHSRFLTRTNKTVGRLQSMGYDAASLGVNIGLFCAGIVMQMTWPGAPTIYYGDEAGVCGWTDPDSRRPFPWGRENRQLQDFYSYMCALHRNEVFRRGAWKPLYQTRYLLAYARMLYGRLAIVVVNAGDSRMEASIPVWTAGFTSDMTLTRVIEADSRHYNVGYHHRKVSNGYLACSMEPYMSKVYINWASDERNIIWK